MSSIISGRFPTILGAGGGSSVTGTTAETQLASVTIPANLLGTRGQIRIGSLWTCNSTAGTKTCRIRFSGSGGSLLINPVLSSTSVTLVDQRVVYAAGATNSQASTGSNTAFGVTLTSDTFSVDTTAATTLYFSGQLNTTSDTLTLAGYTVEFIPGV